MYAYYSQAAKGIVVQRIILNTAIQTD